jgi:hypothetical protein
LGDTYFVITPRSIRAIVLLWCAGGIAGMIVTSIADSINGAIAFGLLAAAAVVALLLVTAVAGNDAFGSGEPNPDGAAHIEREIAALVKDGCDETRIRQLVRHSVTMGRTMRAEQPTETP